MLIFFLETMVAFGSREKQNGQKMFSFPFQFMPQSETVEAKYEDRLS